MATTTNFGWETPDDTDLVKDGAAAIRTALGGVDTSFVDLKGGTTGQVLSKASNTDLDFVWSADAAGMTNPMTTTGDTIYSSSGSTPTRRAIGTTGQVLTVSGGLPTWVTPAGPSYTYTSFTPVIRQGSTTFTVAANCGRYVVVGNLVHCIIQGQITGGTGTSSNPIDVEWPLTAAGLLSGYPPAGTAAFWDTSASLNYPALANFESSTIMRFWSTTNNTAFNYLGGSGSVFTGSMTSGDFISCNVTYQKA